ncbi:MAG: hypothetical protein H6696_00355 [Deferribacteres bacterium]|nr:hypothetical protein [candidate division KSB1 bacterium]MCB9500356.1 hypothetical protein [Deferribacteres bacterium]
MNQNRRRPSRNSDRGGSRRGSYQGRGQQRNRNREDDEKIQRTIRNAQEMLQDSIHAVCLEELNAYERMRVHQFFDNKGDFETKTYRNGEEHLLWIFPVGKIREYVLEKAREAVKTGEEIELHPMSNYERFIVHDVLKDDESVETTSIGEGDERFVKIVPVRFGRKLRKMARKLKLF